MNPHQFVSKLCDRFPVEFQREVLLTARIIFQFQHDNLYDAQFADGRPVRQSDLIGQREWFRDLAEAAQQIAQPEGVAVRAPRDYTCPDCHHAHEGKKVCTFYLGEGKFCQCESKVTA